MIVNIGGIVLAKHLDEESFEFVEAEKKIKVKPAASNHAKFVDPLFGIKNQSISRFIFRSIETADGTIKPVVTGVVITDTINQFENREIFIGDRETDGEVIDPSDWMVKEFRGGKMGEPLRPFYFRNDFSLVEYSHVYEGLQKSLEIGLKSHSNIPHKANIYVNEYFSWDVEIRNGRVKATPVTIGDHGLISATPVDREYQVGELIRLNAHFSNDYDGDPSLPFAVSNINNPSLGGQGFVVERRASVDTPVSANITFNGGTLILEPQGVDFAQGAEMVITLGEETLKLRVIDGYRLTTEASDGFPRYEFWGILGSAGDMLTIIFHNSSRTTPKVQIGGIEQEVHTSGG